MANDTPAAVPLTRDLAELVNALVIVEAELKFQSERLGASDDEYLQRLGGQYANSMRSIVTLRRFQEAQLRRARDRAAQMQERIVERTAPLSDHPDAVDADGIAAPYLGES